MSTLARGRWVITLAVGAVAIAGCIEERSIAEPPSVFAEVSPILEENCLECHGGPLAAANYRVEDYFTTIRCIPDAEGPPATLPPDDSAPILAVLEKPSHADLLDAEDTSSLTTWVTEGAVPNSRGTHPGR
ncbi:MAG: hypothetical protein WBN60_03970, partial [Polyangiales bacterium]